MIRLTGLWQGTDKDGRPYWSGPLSQTARLLILENRYKQSDTQPTHVAFVVPAEKKDTKPQGQDRGRY